MKAIDIRNNLFFKNENDFLLFDPLILNSINFILNLILHQNSLYSFLVNDGYLTEFQDKFEFILKRINESTIEYKYIFRFANLYENKKEDISETEIVLLNSLSNSFMIKFINSSLNILVFLGKLSGLSITSKKANPVDNNHILKDKNLENNSNNKIKTISQSKSVNLLGSSSKEKPIQKITEKMNENNREEILLNFIKIPNITIKRKIIEILLTVNYDQISDSEFEWLIITFKSLNFLDTNMEDILTKLFLFIIRLLNRKDLKNEGGISNVKTSIEFAIKIANELNSQNYFTDEKKFKSTQNLNLILSVFLINLSSEKKYDYIYLNGEAKEKLENKQDNLRISNYNENVETIKKIILNEIDSIKMVSEKNQDLISKVFPLFYEKIYAMWNINNIREFLFYNNIKPYNFIVFRIFRQMADILLNIPYPIFDVFDEENQIETVLRNLKEEFKQREVNAVEKEKKAWGFSLKSSKNKKLKNDEKDITLKNYLQDNISSKNIKNKPVFNLDSKIINKLNFKGKLIHLTEENLNNQRFIFADKFKEFLNFLCGDSNEIQKRLTELKYDERLKTLDNTINNHNNEEDYEYNRIYLYQNFENSSHNNYSKANEEKSYFNLIKDFFGISSSNEENNNRFNKNRNSNDYINNIDDSDNQNNLIRHNSHHSYKMFNDKNLEPLILNNLKTMDKSSNPRHFNFNFYSYVKEDLREECDFYGTSTDNVYRIKEHETVDNCYLRCLIVSAFLRCIYALTKYANKEKESKAGIIGRDFIKTLRNTNTFQKLILLVDSTKMQDFNINTKLLIIIRHIFEKISQRKEDKVIYNLNDKKHNFSNNDHNGFIGEYNHLSRVTKFEFHRLVIISSIIIQKTLDNIYLNQRTFVSDVNEEDYTLLVRKLIKCCLCIKNEIFKNSSLNSQEKKELLRKILSTRLILVLINHALKIMENDIPLQKKLQAKQDTTYFNPKIQSNQLNNRDRNYHSNSNSNVEHDNSNCNTIDNNDLEENQYNQYFIDLIILLAEFISCRQEIYTIIIEYVCKKYYIEKKSIRQSFIKDLSDLRHYSFCTKYLDELKKLKMQKNSNHVIANLVDESDNILFISVSKVIFANHEYKNRNSEINFKINQNFIDNEVCIIILDQNSLIIKKYEQNIKILEVLDILEAKRLARIDFTLYPFKCIKYCSYGNRVFFKHFENKYCFSVFFKKTIEAHLFLSAIKNIKKKIDFHKINLIIENNDENIVNKKIEDLNEDKGKNIFSFCKTNCYNQVDTKDTKELKKNKKNKEDDHKNDVNMNKKIKKEDEKKDAIQETNDKESVNLKNKKIFNLNKKDNSKYRSISSTNSDMKSRKKTNQKTNIERISTKKEDDNRKDINSIVDKKLKMKKELSNDEFYELLKQKNSKILEEKNKLNESCISRNSKISIRSKSGKLKTQSLLTSKSHNKQMEVAEKNENNINFVDLSKYIFNDKIFVVGIDFSNFSNIDDLNDEAFYRNIYIVKLDLDFKITIYKEKEFDISEFIIDFDKSSSDDKITEIISRSIYELNKFDLDSVKNIIFDNRKIIIEFKNTMDYIFSRPIQIYPIDDRAFFYLRNYFVKYLYRKGFQNYSRNYIAEPISSRIFKN